MPNDTQDAVRELAETITHALLFNQATTTSDVERIIRDALRPLLEAVRESERLCADAADEVSGQTAAGRTARRILERVGKRLHDGHARWKERTR